MANSFVNAMLAVLVLAAAPAASFSQSKTAGAAGPVATSEQIEADWLHQDSLRSAAPGGDGRGVTPQQDAIGACDGIKDGKWGFHTGNEDDPWWQIDLVESAPLDRLILYNRCDLAERNSRIRVLVSDDAGSFRQVYQHDGTTFLGYTDKKPLVVKLNGDRKSVV